MSLETESVLDRRRLKKRLTTWRTAAVIAAALAFGALAFKGGDGAGFGKTEQIARVTISGMILEDRAQLKMLRKIAKDEKVMALLLYVNSPGGTTAGGEALYEALRAVGKKKPVVAQFGTIATSAAYIAGLATDHIVSRGNTITGSVGVIFQWAEVSELLAKLGVKFNEIKSGDMKAEPSPFKPITPAGKKVAEQMVNDSKLWFISLVKARRKIDTAVVPGLEQGRVYSGREALKHKLVDEIGGETQAVKWLESRDKVKVGLKIVDWKPKRDLDLGWIGMSVSAVARLMGCQCDGIIGIFTRAGQLRAISLDGLVSLWHPAKS